MILKNRQQRLTDLAQRGAEAISPADVLANDGDAYKALLTRKLETTGQIAVLEDKLDRECSETAIFPAPAPDEHLESQYEDQQSGSDDY